MSEPKVVNLPEKVFVPVVRKQGKQGDVVEAVKAVNPEGKQIPVAFTKPEYLRQFADATGMSKMSEVKCMEMPTAALLDQLASHHEPEVCIDPMQESEATLSYKKEGAVSRQYLPHGALMDVKAPSFSLPENHLQDLRRVAEELPTIEALWLMEMAIRNEGQEGEPETRPLLVLKQSVPEGHELFQDAFMEMGDRWCETLPRGIAVDMLPDHALPVAGKLSDQFLVYQRKK